MKPDTIIYEVSDGLFVGNIESQNYIYTNVKINNVVFDKLSIIESNRRLIGVVFFASLTVCFGIVVTKKSGFIVIDSGLIVFLLF